MKINMSLFGMDARRAACVLTALFCASFACLLVSCGSVKSQRLPYAGATHFAPGDPHTVTILRKEPTRPHERIGEILIDASGDPLPSIKKIEEKIRTQAAKMGADAVVIVHDGVMPTDAYVSGSWWGRSMDVTDDRKLVGVAIKYYNID